MANLQVNQIRKHLTDNYIRFVDASDIKATDEDKDIHILSRAYAAYACFHPIAIMFLERKLFHAFSFCPLQ